VRRTLLGLPVTLCQHSAVCLCVCVFVCLCDCVAVWLCVFDSTASMSSRCATRSGHMPVTCSSQFTWSPRHCCRRSLWRQSESVIVVVCRRVPSGVLLPDGHYQPHSQRGELCSVRWHWHMIPHAVVTAVIADVLGAPCDVCCSVVVPTSTAPREHPRHPA
jgi:hypothetical protein